MGRKSRPSAGHSGQTESGNTKDIKVERVGPVTIYERGMAYYLYFVDEPGLPFSGTGQQPDFQAVMPARFASIGRIEIPEHEDA